MIHASVQLIALIALGSLVTGCGTKQSLHLDPPPLVLSLSNCPKPSRPVWPLIDGEMPFDAPVNIEALLLRDDMTRFYAKALEDTIRCYEMQTKTNDSLGAVAPLSDKAGLWD